MKIHFIGLSSFLIENKKGFRILIDPFNDASEWSLGPKFPKTFNNKPFGTNLLLVSEPDADHCYSPGDWLEHAPPTKPGSVPFPELNLRGTIIHEFNGDLNVAWHYTIDGLRIAHFADLSHALTKDQLKELKKPDIVFMSPPKVDRAEALNFVRENIKKLKPKIVIWAHHLAPKGMPKTEDKQTLRRFFISYFEKNASSNKNYDKPEGFLPLCYVLENAYVLNREYSGMILDVPMIEVNKPLLNKGAKKPISILFKAMLSDV